MDSMMVLFALYGILICIDLIPLMRKKRGKALYLSIPVYLLTLTINSMAGLGFKFGWIGPIMQQFIISILHLK